MTSATVVFGVTDTSTLTLAFVSEDDVDSVSYMSLKQVRYDRIYFLMFRGSLINNLHKVKKDFQ
jgi:hypothetical protein